MRRAAEQRCRLRHVDRWRALSAAATLAHVGHMKFENPHGDSWTQARGPWLGLLKLVSTSAFPGGAIAKIYRPG